MLNDQSAGYWRSQAKLALDLYKTLQDPVGKEALLHFANSFHYMAAGQTKPPLQAT